MNENIKKRKKSLKVARGMTRDSEIAGIAGKHLLLSLGLFFLLIFASSIPEIYDLDIDLTHVNMLFRGLFYTPITVVCLLIYAIFAFKWAFGYVALQLMCLKLDKKLDGALEANEAARTGDLEAVQQVANQYLADYGVRVGPSSILRVIDILLTIIEIAFAIISVVVILMAL